MFPHKKNLNNLGSEVNRVPLATYLPAQSLAEPSRQMQALGQPKQPRQKRLPGSPDLQQVL